MDAALLQRLAATHVVLPEGIAAIDDDVAAFHQLGQRVDRGFRDLAGRQHHPGGSRLLELPDKIVKRARAERAVGSNGCDRLRILVVNDGGVSVFHQPADYIAAHPTEADHAELHFLYPQFNAWWIALSSIFKPASRSPLRCTRRARRPRSVRTSKSPRACAALMTPKLAF